jgi:hypothetical protein
MDTFQMVNKLLAMKGKQVPDDTYAKDQFIYDETQDRFICPQVECSPEKASTSTTGNRCMRIMVHPAKAVLSEQYALVKTDGR